EGDFVSLPGVSPHAPQASAARRGVTGHLLRGLHLLCFTDGARRRRILWPVRPPCLYGRKVDVIEFPKVLFRLPARSPRSWHRATERHALSSAAGRDIRLRSGPSLRRRGPPAASGR